MYRKMFIKLSDTNFDKGNVKLLMAYLSIFLKFLITFLTKFQWNFLNSFYTILSETC